MKHLWAPWRIDYILGEKAGGCIFCDKPREGRDQQNYVLYRGSANFIMLNSYPYNPGHLMVASYRHVRALSELGDEELLEHFRLAGRSADVLDKVLHPAGFNMGVNLGRAAGAGVEGHIHTHIVPRWNGDTNFMCVAADTRVVPEALAETYAKLAVGFAELA